jgi:MoaA/NifB/PqqE/SkfB family radical SAM enzyme
LYCSSPYQKTSELSLEQWQQIIFELSTLGCQRVGLLGGEPLVRGDLADIVSAIKENRMQCVLTSNGLLVPRFIDRLKDLDTLVLSLDGLGAANDATRGKGVYKAVLKAIDAAKDAEIPVKLNAVMNRESAPFLDDLLHFAEDRDVSISVNFVRTGNTLWHQAASVKQDDQEIRSLLLKLSRMARTNNRLLFSEQTYRYAATWKDYSIDRLASPEPGKETQKDMPKCHAGLSYISIDPDGKCFPCALTSNQISGENASDVGVLQAWRSVQQHDCVSCYSPCMVEQNYLHSLNIKVLGQFARKHLKRYA